MAKKHKPLFLEYRVFSIKEISVPAWHDAVESAVAANIADSIKLHGVLNAPIVRMRKQDGKKTPELIAGRGRLEGATLAGQAKIRCRVVKANSTMARMMSLSEDLWRKDLTVLVRAEKTVAWIKRAASQSVISGQVVQKGEIGRPPNPLKILAAGASLLAGDTPQARLKRFARYKKIANLTPEAKVKARELGLDNIQAALLEVAEAGPSVSGQLGRLEAISLRNKNVYLQQPAKGDLDEAVAPSSEPKSVAKRVKTEEKSTAPNSDIATPTTMIQLEEFWEKGGKALWTYTRLEDRVRFIAMLNRAICKVKIEPVEVVRLVMRGRNKVEAKRLYAYAKANGVSKEDVRIAAGYQGHRCKRQRAGEGNVWFFINGDPDGKNEIRAISDAELRHLVDEKRDDYEDVVTSSASEPYYES
jgi:hypothetical protein